jgi:acyl-CoA synthetase (AMP-forming)/AMP-acid ligase II
MNIATILDMAAEAFGERPGLVDGDRRLSYAELRNAAWNGAQRVRESGAACLAFLDVNGAAASIGVFAAAYAGVSYVPLNYRLTPAEINELLARIAPALLIVGEEYRTSVATPGISVMSTAEFLALASDADAPPVESPDDPSAIAVQLFTSGTTGKPKAAILRHENLMSYIVGTVEFASAEENDAIVVTVPPYHIAGISAVLSSTYACRRMVVLAAFEPGVWLDVMRRERVSNAFLVPTMLQRVVEHLERNGAKPDVPDLRSLAYGGGKMPLSTIQKAMQWFPAVDFTNAYGLTETSSTIAVLGPDEHRAAATSQDPAIRRRLGSVGKATGAVEIQIRNEDGQVLGPEDAGLVFVRGPQVSGEYLALGSQLDGEGWFPTKDRGYLDAEGYLFLDGRADDVIVRGGENISPGEIEDVLLSHPSVADAVVVAMPDEQWGEAVAAAVVLKPGSDAAVSELQERVRSQLRSSRVPQAIVFRDALPYNDTGKILRRVIRAEFSEGKTSCS